MVKRKKKKIIGFSLFGFLGLGIGAFAMEYNAFSISGEIDIQENAIDLSWNQPDTEEPYTYQLYQKKEGSDEFQSISTTDLDKNTVVRALNIFPVNNTSGGGNIIPQKSTGEVDLAGKPLYKSAMLKEWIGEYGHGNIQVDAINQNDFDANPDKYLKDENGNYKYDVSVVGFWNINAGQNQNLEDNGIQALREFAESGRGLLTGHHHIGLRELDKGMNQLKDLFGVKFVGEQGWNQYQDTWYHAPVPMDYAAPEKSNGPHGSRYWSEANQVVAVQKGLLLEYPNYVSEEGRVFDIPLTHNGGDFVTGDVWLEFKNPYAKGHSSMDPIELTKLPDGTKGSKNSYLSTYNNTALIQIGHSSLTSGGSDLSSTEDEMKIVANTVFYLAQLTTDTSHKDRSGMDVDAPDLIKGISYNNLTNAVSFTTPKDNGTTYEYYVEATGQDTREKKRSRHMNITNTSGLAGYSYVVDDKSNTTPDSKIETSSNDFQLDLSKSTGSTLHIAAVDKAGNVSEVVHLDLNLIELEGSVDHENNAINLEWNDMPDNSQPYTYKVYQDKEGSEGFQSISTADLKKKVNVLNVYPEVSPQITYTTHDGTERTIDKSASLEMWMESPNAESQKGYGMGLINVDPVGISEFNANPNSFLKDEEGNWKYDAVFFGAWDSNSAKDLSVEARDAMIPFIESGRGTLFGHDTLLGNVRRHHNFVSLRNYVNTKIGVNYDYPSIPLIRGNKVEIAKRGLLIEYPWEVGDIGTVLTVPESHSTGQIALGDVWMKYATPSGSIVSEPGTGLGTNNFYLTTWNNAAMIQTGHSDGAATPDEQKVLANTLFYLSQLTTETEVKDRSGMDVEAPDQIKKVSYNNKTNVVSLTTPKDNGSAYKYYVEATGQNNGVTHESDQLSITNISGLSGYSYVIDDKPDTIPDNTVEETSSSFDLDLGSGTGNMLHIRAVDKAGNASKTTHLKLDILELEGSVDHKDNAMDLDWSEMPDKSQPYTYKVYQDKEGNGSFQSISTADLKKKVKVLNVYPDVSPKISYTTWDGTSRTIPKSASVEMWMESPNAEHSKGYGMGLIDVEPVSLTSFNANPNAYLKDSEGNWKYDTVFFGAWDCNSSCGSAGDLSTQAASSLRPFVESGRGILFGHDTILDTRHPNFSSLRGYANIKVKNYDFDISPGTNNSTKVKIGKKGLLTQSPWNIGEIGTVLNIPMAHNSYQIGLGDIWMTFEVSNKPIADPNTGTGSSNFYLTTWNNAAQIQTGHSSGQATPDEQKVLANTLFYLSQLTSETEAKDRSGMDVDAPYFPEKPKVTMKQDMELQVSYKEAVDRGSKYEYYVEGTGQNNGNTHRSNTIELTNKSGMGGYSYIIDDSTTTVPDNDVDVTGNSFSVDLSGQEGNYLHLVAVDKTGNISEVFHYKIDDTPPTFDIVSSEKDWTNVDVHLQIVNIDDHIGFGYLHTILPNGTVMESESPTYTVSQNGRYTFYVVDRVGNKQSKDFVVGNIDKVIPNLQFESNQSSGKLNVQLNYSDK